MTREALAEASARAAFFEPQIPRILFALQVLENAIRPNQTTVELPIDSANEA
jgi:hypothetical protein